MEPEHELWAYNSTNNTAWCAADIRTNYNYGSWPANGHLIGDVIYFTASGGDGRELYAHNTTNGTTWVAADIHTCNLCDSDPGEYLSIVVGDTIYFDADDGSTGRELWAYNTSNETYWQVINIGGGSASSNPGDTMEILVGDTIYFNAYDSNTGYYGMWAHNTSNGTTWQAADFKSLTGHSNAYIGTNLIGNPVVIGDTIFFDAPNLIHNIITIKNCGRTIPRIIPLGKFQIFLVVHRAKILEVVYSWH